jgi:hypothetical protein
MSNDIAASRGSANFIVLLVRLLLLLEVRLAAVSSYSTAQYEAGVATKQVVTLNRENFQKAISNDPANSFWFLKFFAPW